MLKLAKLGIAIAAFAALIVPAAYAGVPDVTQSYFVPQAIVSAAVVEGTSATTGATRFYKQCPNNDGGSALPNNPRLKVFVKDSGGNPIPGIPGADICVLLNGGLPSQGFSGLGADSIVAAATIGVTSTGCPDLRCMNADSATDANGVAYITFTGNDNPAHAVGVAVRSAARKWGRYDSELPVYVLGFKLPGRVTSTCTPFPGATCNFTLRIKNFDIADGYTAGPFERVTINDYNVEVARLGLATSAANWYWANYDESNPAINVNDLNQVVAHLSPTNHTCVFPNNP